MWPGYASHDVEHVAIAALKLFARDKLLGCVVVLTAGIEIVKVY